MRFLARCLFRTIVFLLVVVVGGFAALQYYLRRPVMHPTVIVTIEPGMGLGQVARRLGARGVIGYPAAFIAYGQLEGDSRHLKAGEYQFPPGLTPREVYAKLLRGDVVTYEIRIPEGWTMQQIADYTAKQPFVSDAAQFTKDFLAACRDQARVARLGVAANTLEGFLFPSTYHIQRPKTAGEVVDRLVTEFERQFDATLRQQAAARELTMLQVVTLASIVEKETGRAEERPLVSAVFHNRLKIKMPLAADPTVIYGLPNFDGNIRRRDLENPHPYNTYIHAGLPPGPIANPGRAALEAALAPAAVDYLFFVAKPDGAHHFTTNYADHLSAVNQYQRGSR